MSGNYTEETKPLFKLLRTEAFRFVLVHFNHYSLLHQLKEDLRNRYPDRAMLEVDAQRLTYRQMADAYYQLGQGFFIINNFESVLADPDKYTGLNLRRDKLAKYPIALICFISPGVQELSAKDIMEKMPDLWSFRSLMLNLQMDIPVTGLDIIKNELFDTDTKISSLGGYNSTDKLQELERLKNLVAETPLEEKALLVTLYQQIKDIQKDIGFYSDALETIGVLKEYSSNTEDLGILSFEEGELLVKLDNYKEALDAFNIAMTLFLEQEEENKFQLGFVNERLGSIHMEMKNFEEANYFFLKFNNLLNELYLAYPQNNVYKNGLGVSYIRLGEAQVSIRNFDKALTFYEKFNHLEKEIYESDPHNPDFKNVLAISYAKLGEIHTSLGNLDKALAYYYDFNHIAIELYELYPERGDFKTALAVSYTSLGEAHALLADFERALINYKEANHLAKELFELYPQNISFKKRLARSCSELGSVQTSLGNLDQALEYYEEYNHLEKELYDAYPQNLDVKRELAISYEKLGSIEDSLGNFSNALVYYEKCNQLEKELSETYPLNADFKKRLAVSFLQLGMLHGDKLKDLKKARSYFQAAQEHWANAFGSDTELGNKFNFLSNI